MLTNYLAAVNWLHKGLVLCNNLPQVDPSVYDNVHQELYDEETGEFTDVYQWFITGYTADDIEWMEKTFPDLIFTYSDMLDVFVLCVDHFGTCWDYVMTTCTNEICVRTQGEKI